MHAIRQHEFGGPEVLRFEEVPLPVPAAGQVRVAVEVVGVHLLDTSMRAGGDTGPLPHPELPVTPGREVAGLVDAVGEGIDAAWVGRRVVAHLGPAGGGYAERVVTDASRLHHVPDDLPLTHAVAMIGTGRTALLVLRQAQLRPEDVVLIPSAAGGMGALLVQAALRVGASVIALAGGEAKTERVARLAAHAAAAEHGRLLVADYLADGWPDRLREALGDREPTVLLDGVGGQVAHDLTPLLRWGGRTLVFGWSGAQPADHAPDDAWYAARGLTRTVALGPLDPDDLRDLETGALAAAAARELVPLVDDRFPLREAAAAHAALEARATTGKVVLRAA